MKQRRRVIVVIALVLLCLAVPVGWTGWRTWALRPIGGSGGKVRITIAPEATAASVGGELETRHLIRSAFWFERLSAKATLKPGIYEFSPTERPSRILARLEKGDVITVRVTFPEGFTDQQVAHRLHRLEMVPDEATFQALISQQGSAMKASFPLPANLEGYLFPDTYRFPLGADNARIAQQMVGEFDRLIVKGKASEIKASGRSLADIVNVAAMVEREAETDADRAPIAGVIYNRLKRGMHLEIDATVQYAQGYHKSRLLFKDLTIDSPYNTYKHPGLPPGPICNPGLPSLLAAMHPAQHDFLYYVGRPDGSHIFARTFAEHQHNIALVRHMPAATPHAPPATTPETP